MRELNLKTLRLLVAVCDHQNMARAAEQEHIEASAISKRIAQLEADLGTQLLVRDRRGVHPTPAGLSLLEHARTMLFTWDRIVDEVSGFDTRLSGQVRLVASTSAIAEALLDDLAAFMRIPENERIRVDIEEHSSRELVRRIHDGQASVGICWDSTNLSALEFRNYRDDQLALAVHPDHPLANRASLRFDQSLDYEHIGLNASSAVYATLQRAAARVGRSISYRVVVSNFDSAFRVVAANLGVSVLPVEVAAQSAAMRGIKLIPLTDSWSKRRFIICFQRFAALQPASQRLVEFLVARAGGRADQPVGQA